MKLKIRATVEGELRRRAENAITKFLATLDDEINALTEKRERFSTLRTSAIHDLITGKIRLFSRKF